MLCDIEVQDAPTIVTDDEKTIEHAEGDRRNSEEVHRGNRFPVIAEKGEVGCSAANRRVDFTCLLFTGRLRTQIERRCYVRAGPSE